MHGSAPSYGGELTGTVVHRSKSQTRSSLRRYTNHWVVTARRGSVVAISRMLE